MFPIAAAHHDATSPRRPITLSSIAKELGHIQDKEEEDDEPVEGPDGVVTLRGKSNPPLEPIPLVRDILRTKYCIPGSVFLVESIEKIPILSSKDTERPRTVNGLLDPHAPKLRRAKRRMIRLLLGDGELCIQALLKPQMHFLVNNGKVYEGCYVRVDKFELRWFDMEGEEEVVRRGDVEDDRTSDPAAAAPEKQKKLTGDAAKIWYLLVGDITAVGWNKVYMEMLEAEDRVAEQAKATAAAAQPVPRTRTLGQVKGDGGKVLSVNQLGKAIAVQNPVSADKMDKVLSENQFGKVVAVRKPVPVHQSDKVMSVNQLGKAVAVQNPVSVHKTDQVLSEKQLGKTIQQPVPDKAKPAPAAAEENFDDLDYISDSGDDLFESLLVSAGKATERLVAGNNDPLQELQAAVIEQNQKAKSSPWVANDLSTPLKLTPLRSIPNLPYKQNWMTNVLAVVASLSDVEPSHLPPYRQRTARLADPSTSKRVLLNVFLDPDQFSPAVGSVVLLVGVKNHRFDGGCLKKYASDKPKNGTSWWLENPEALGWCVDVVVRLRSWWQQQQQNMQ
ncbi:hypothetical protein B0H66DRAFT_563064 [Apodospora peruviana]|uniref:Uncharacterized protein n=1 Tax=Apodospora peruviana TaxID=516989 RepID=A0AAE0M0M1_9PEZI|nr:hypothetical protein B0H66DRAFT_563064 [Apodospora peruviana]